jgi:HlyD family secretion protein
MPATLTRSSWIVLVLALIGGGIWYLTRPKPIEVVVKTVARGKVEATVANTRAGTVKACRRSGISPAIGGQIAILPVKEGDRVAAGQVLLELWNDDLRARLLLAERDSVAAVARAEQACVAAEVADREANRLSKLRQRGLASEEQTDRAVGEATAQAAACRAGLASSEVGKAQVAVAHANLERTILRAPFEGTVAEINGELGEFVTPSPVGIPTPAAVDLIDSSCLYVTAPIDEVDVPAIRTGMATRITLDAFPGKDFPGQIRRIAPYVLAVEKQARTVDIEVDFLTADEFKDLLPGYSADVEIVVKTRPDVLRVPTEAVLQGDRVLVYQPGSQTLAERPIETGVSNWVYTEVVAGLNSGDQVVTSVDREGVAAGAYVVPEDRGGQ